MRFPDIKDGLPEGIPEFTLPSNNCSIAQLLTREVYRNIDEPDDNPLPHHEKLPVTGSE